MSTKNDASTDRWKEAAGEAASLQLENSMIVGLGSGTTATLAVAAIGRRVASGLKITGVPTSEKTADQARQLGIPLTTLEECCAIDVTIDGADEVQSGTLTLIKGGGGNLLREKIVAVASARMIVVADENKVVSALGSRSSVPVEVVPFGWKTTAKRLEQIGAVPTLRMGSDGAVYLTDGGNHILDCTFPSIASPRDLAVQLDSIVGVVEHGLFIGIASEVVIGGAAGIQVIRPDS